MSLDKRRDEARRAFEAAKEKRQPRQQEMARKPDKPPELVLKPKEPLRSQGDAEAHRQMARSENERRQEATKRAFEERRKALADRSITKDFNRER